MQWLLLLRALVGFALGGTPIAVTLFAEFCTSARRGQYLLLMQSFWTVGTVMEALLAWAVLPHLGWRWLLALSALPLLLLLAVYPWLPESPHWLVAKGRYADAEAVLQRVAAANGHGRPLRLRLDSGGGGSRRLGGSDGEDGGSAAAGAAGEGAAVAGDKSLQASGSGHVSVSMQRARSPAVPPLAKLATSPNPQTPLLHAAEQPRGLLGRTSSPSAAAAVAPAAGRQPPQRAPSGRRLRSALHTMRAGLAVVFGPQLRRTTLLLYIIWSVNALVYYGACRD